MKRKKEEEEEDYDDDEDDNILEGLGSCKSVVQMLVYIRFSGNTGSSHGS